MTNEILDFIDGFKFIHKKELEEVFLYGNCYYFAVILTHRFKKARIYYDNIDDHFIVKYKGRFYDISGDVTEKYPNAFKWNKWVDRDLKYIIKRDEINLQNRNKFDN